MEIEYLSSNHNKIVLFFFVIGACSANSNISTQAVVCECPYISEERETKQKY